MDDVIISPTKLKVVRSFSLKCANCSFVYHIVQGECGKMKRISVDSNLPRVAYSVFLIALVGCVGYVLVGPATGVGAQKFDSKVVVNPTEKVGNGHVSDVNGAASCDSGQLTGRDLGFNSCFRLD